MNFIIMEKGNNFCEKLHNHSKNSEEMLKNMPPIKSFENASNTFQLISDPTRLKILWLLCHLELCVNDIAISTKMTSPAVSHHLKLLKQTGLIESRRNGKEMFYKLSDTAESKLVHKAIDDILDIKCPK